LVERESDRRRVILLSGLLMRLPVFLMALVPLLPQHLRAGAVVCIATLGTIPAAVGTVSFTAMLADVVPPRDRVRVVSMRNAMLATATTVTVLTAGKVLDILPFPIGYQFIFTMAFAASVVSLYYLGRVVIKGGDEPQEEARGHGERLDLRRVVPLILGQRDYVRFTLGSFVYHWGIHFPIALYSIYRVRELQLSEGWIGALAMLESGVTIIAYYSMGKLAQRYGSRTVLLIGLALVCLHPFGMALSSTPWPLLFFALLAGIAGPAFNLGLFNNLLEVAPVRRRATYIALFNTLMNTAAFVSPLLGTSAATLLGIRRALLIGGAGRVLGLLAFACLL
jgi:MFS family permease